jgi:V/A-type H+-transporting ATPase subunit F
MNVMVIGHPEAVLGFALVGVRGLTAQTADEASRALDDALDNPKVGIILVTQDVAALLPSRMDQLKLRSTVPLVVEVPGPQGMPADYPPLSELIRRAIGIKI